MDCVELLSGSNRRDHVVTTSRVEGVQELALAREARIVCKIVYDNQNLKQFFVAPLLQEVGDLVLRLQNIRQSFGVVVVKIDWFLRGVLYLHVLIDVVLHRSPGHIYLDRWAENENSAEAISVDVQDHVLKKDRLARTAGTKDDRSDRKLPANFVFRLLYRVFFNFNGFYFWCFAHTY